MAGALRNRISVYVPGTGWVDLPFFSGPAPVPGEVRQNQEIEIPLGVPIEVLNIRSHYTLDLSYRYIGAVDNILAYDIVFGDIFAGY